MPRAAGRARHVQKLDKQGRAYATGKRKDAIARVWIKPGTGKIIINDKEYLGYFARPVLQMILNQPLVAANRQGQFDIVATVVGGGLSGQAGAVRHGISKALTYYEPGLRGVLKKGGFLTRDSRTVERKKYGKAKARRPSSSRSADFSGGALVPLSRRSIRKGPPLAGRPFRFAALGSDQSADGRALGSCLFVVGPAIAIGLQPVDAPPSARRSG